MISWKENNLLKEEIDTVTLKSYLEKELENNATIKKYGVVFKDTIDEVLDYDYLLHKLNDMGYDGYSVWVGYMHTMYTPIMTEVKLDDRKMFFKKLVETEVVPVVKKWCKEQGFGKCAVEMQDKYFSEDMFRIYVVTKR